MNRILLSFLILSVVLSCSCPVKEAKVEKETYLYSVKNADSLYLDRYVSSAVSKPEACVIFLFGGGFVGGVRDAKDYIPYFNSLAESGITVVSIDYRLGMKGVTKESLTTPEQFVAILKHTIDMAVEDLYDATNYVLKRTDWNIDPSRVIISGSSAGAVSVLQAEYDLVNSSVLAQKLPEGFNYAGVISFAGAVLSLYGDLTFSEETCPIMLFHGNADSNVPYDKMVMGDIGFYGSNHIAFKLKESSLPFYFCSVNNAAHEIANTPMNDNVDEIKIFIDKFVLLKQPLFMESIVEQIGKPELRKDFEPYDYITANYGN